MHKNVLEEKRLSFLQFGAKAPNPNEQFLINSVWHSDARMCSIPSPVRISTVPIDDGDLLYPAVLLSWDLCVQCKPVSVTSFYRAEEIKCLHSVPVGDLVFQ